MVSAPHELGASHGHAARSRAHGARSCAQLLRTAAAHSCCAQLLRTVAAHIHARAQHDTEGAPAAADEARGEPQPDQTRALTQVRARAGDQTLYSWMSVNASGFQRVFARLPCGWNRQIGTHMADWRGFWARHRCEQRCHVLHGNGTRERSPMSALCGLEQPVRFGTICTVWATFVVWVAVTAWGRPVWFGRACLVGRMGAHHASRHQPAPRLPARVSLRRHQRQGHHARDESRPEWRALLRDCRLPPPRRAIPARQCRRADARACGAHVLWCAWKRRVAGGQGQRPRVGARPRQSEGARPRRARMASRCATRAHGPSRIVGGTKAIVSCACGRGSGELAPFEAFNLDSGSLLAESTTPYQLIRPHKTASVRRTVARWWPAY